MSLGCDGTTYYFNHSGRLASVWMAQGGRTAQLVHIAQRLCHAVEHQDTAVLNQQMELCKSLAKEFKQEYPDRYFQPSWKSRSSGDKGPWRCELSGGHCMGLEVLFDTAVSDEAFQNVNDLYRGGIVTWMANGKKRISLKIKYVFPSTNLLTFFVFLHVHYYSNCFETKCRAIYQQIDG